MSGRLLEAIRGALADPVPGFDRHPASAWGGSYRPIRGQLLAPVKDAEATVELD